MSRRWQSHLSYPTRMFGLSKTRRRLLSNTLRHMILRMTICQKWLKEEAGDTLTDVLSRTWRRVHPLVTLWMIACPLAQKPTAQNHKIVLFPSRLKCICSRYWCWCCRRCCRYCCCFVVVVVTAVNRSKMIWKTRYTTNFWSFVVDTVFNSRFLFVYLFFISVRWIREIKISRFAQNDVRWVLQMCPTPALSYQQMLYYLTYYIPSRIWRFSLQNICRNIFHLWTEAVVYLKCHEHAGNIRDYAVSHITGFAFRFNWQSVMTPIDKKPDTQKGRRVFGNGKHFHL